MKIGIEREQMILTKERFEELNALRINGKMPNHSVLASEAIKAARWLTEVATCYGSSEERRRNDRKELYLLRMDLELHLANLISLLDDEKQSGL